MVKTYGLTHVAVAVADLDRTEAFYAAVLGAVRVYRDAGFMQMQTPGSRDVLVFEKDAARAGKAGGVLHFGFRLTRASDIDDARAAVSAAGGVIVDTGEFVPGEPYLFTSDPDGYTIELWYEIPTPVDPKPRRAPTRRSARSRQ
jgi:catechol 2,3-dioxygenase-like lactoylglutathione lyase family enzyme